MSVLRSEHGPAGNGRAMPSGGRRSRWTPSRGTLLIALILLVAAAFRFHRLDWGDQAWPQPDERAMAAQTFDMMVRDDYRPTIHSWGHFGYYSTLFAYKAFLWSQHALNGAPLIAGERLVSASGPAVPHFREIIRGGGALPLGLAVVVTGWLVVAAVRRSLRHPRRLALAAVVLATTIAVAAPWVRAGMLAPVEPDYDDLVFLGRFLSALVSTVSVALVYAIGARLYRRSVGLLAAAFLAVAVLPIQLAHFYIVDPMQAFAVLLAMSLATLLLHPGAAGSMAIETVPARTGPPWALLALYPAVGAAVGLALASKFSSLPLLALPLIAHGLAWGRVGRRAPLAAYAALMLAYVAALGAWFALQPYAWESEFTPYAEAAAATGLRRRWLEILFSRAFAEQILEQSLMAQGRAGGPWVQQFAGTIPFLTVTAQLVRFGLGWPLGLAAIAGLAWCAVLNLRRPRAADLLLLSWAAVLFVTLGVVEATFARYAVPLVPFLCLFAALLCLGREPRVGATETGASPFGAARRHAWTAAWASALAGGLFWSVAYVRIYDQPHAWTRASLWIFKNVSPVRADGRPTRIAHEEWDDSIPLRLPPYQSERYDSVLMALYEDDSEEKLHRLSRWLEEADWICLPTTRLYGTILGVSRRYPLTASYYKALFAGRLGFTLRRTIAERPRLWRLVVDDLVDADESHYVYDHPKAVIFEKTERLDRSELERRIRDLPPALEMLSREQLLLWRESTRETVRNVARDPYLEDAIVTRSELESLMRAEELDPASTQALLAAIETTDAATDAVEAGALGAIVGSVSSRPDAAEIASLRRQVESLEISRAHRAADLRRIAEANLVESASRDRLVARLRFPVEGRLVPRDAVLEKLDHVEIGVGPPQFYGRGSAPRAGPRRVKVVAEDGRSGGLGAAIAWLVVLEALGFAVLPWTVRLFSALPGTGYLLAKTFGWVLATYVCWMIVSLGLAELGAPAARAAFVLVAAAAWGPRAARRRLSELLPPARLVIVAELLFIATFAGFALVRATNPEIFWGEKTMDFSLLNGLLRGGTLPPYEPWFSGASLNYYYYGFVLVAFLTLLPGTASSIAFNLAIPTIAGLSVLGAFAVCHALTRRIRWGLAGAVLVGFVANLDWVYQLGRRGSALRSADGSRWDSWWATSRALSEGLINEYPVWGWLFGDLHAHVMATPLLLFAIALVLALCADRRIDTRRGRAVRAATWGVLALTLGAQLATNTWDFLASSCLVAFALGGVSLGAATSPQRRRGEGASGLLAPLAGREALGSGLAFEVSFVIAWTVLWPLVGRLHPYWLGLVADRWIGFALALGLVALGRLGDRPIRLLERGAGVGGRITRDALLPALLLAMAAMALYVPFLSHFHTGETVVGVNGEGFITAIHALRHFGLFALVSAMYVAASVAQLGPTERTGAILLVGGPAVVAAALLRFTFVRDASGVVLYGFLLLAIVIVGAVRRRRFEQRFATVLLACGWGLATASELIVLGDRMNTVFKLYHAAWILLATGSGAALAAIFDQELDPGAEDPVRRHARWARPCTTVAGLLVAGAVVVAAVGAWRGAIAVATLGRKPGDRLTLDGLDFLRHDPRDAELLEVVTWLNEAARGPQVVAEAFTDRGYDESARIAQYTGLPILLGWRHHLVQRGITPQEIALRAADLRRLYTSTDPIVLGEVCRRHGVRYIVVGDLERDRYGSPEERFAAMAFLHQAFRSSRGGYRVYEVRTAHSSPAM